MITTYKEDFLNHLKNRITVKNPEKLYVPIEYILQLGGKRLRPILTIMICEIFGGKKEDSFDAALAIEVFHNFTLIHDDIMDAADVRRGKPTVHKKWDVNTGILSGDAMLILAYQCFESYPSEIFKELMLLFNKTSLEVCEGQQLDMDFETRNDVSIDEYIHMISYKTSVLLAAAMQMGAIIAKASKEETQHIYNFGLNLGIAFQLQDDYLDTFGDAAVFGKKIGGDIIENKKTYLYLKAKEVANTEDVAILQELYSTNENSQKKINEVTNLFNKYNIQNEVKRKIEEYTELSLTFVDKLNLEQSSKDILRRFALELMQRQL